MAIPICDLDDIVDGLFDDIDLALRELSTESGHYVMQNLMYRMLERSITRQRGGILPIEENPEEEDGAQEDIGWPPIQESDQPSQGD